MVRRCAVAGVVAFVLPCACPSLSAQGLTAVTAQDRDPGRSTVVECTGQAISNIVILTQPPYTEHLPQRLEIARTAMRLTHVTTQDEVIRHYLLFDIGDPCTEERRADSERILRAMPFLVDARITAWDDGAGGVSIEVATRDEFSLMLSPDIRPEGRVLRGVRFGDRNIGGSAVDIGLLWRDGGTFRDVLGVRMVDYQFGGLRNELRIEAVRFEHGNSYRTELVHPYYTDLQRLAWNVSVGGTTGYSTFLRPDEKETALLSDRRYVSLGAVARVGPVGRLRLIGLSFAREHQRTSDDPVLLYRDSVVADVSGKVPAQYHRQDVSRINLLLGGRRFRFERVEGFDALAGAQDVRVGAQIGLIAGRSLPVLGGQDADRFLASDIYLGFGNQKSFSALQMIAEGKQQIGSGRWENFLTGGRFAWYLRPAVHQLTLTQVEWSAGGNVVLPFQLAMNDPTGGMLGYRATRTPGGQRLVLRTEQRMVFPDVHNVADAGLAVFAESGRLWKGGVPYGVTTPWRASAGISFQAAVPPGSRRLWRLDFGWPIGSDPDARFEVRISTTDRSRIFWTPPADLVRARERTVPGSIFSWP